MKSAGVAWQDVIGLEKQHLNLTQQKQKKTEKNIVNQTEKQT